MKMEESAIYHSPIGSLKITADNQYLLAISFDGQNATPQSTNPIINQAIAELEAYFAGKLKTFSVPYKFTGTDFQNRVWTELSKIPFGKTISYSTLASNLGDLKSIRAAGTANGKNKLPIIIPCHRVIGKDGSLVGFSGGIERKKWLLKHEGVIQGEQIEIFA